MSQTKATTLGFSLIIGFFAVLFFAPKFSERTRFKMDFTGWPPPRADRFPLDRKLEALRLNGKSGAMISLGEIPDSDQGYIVHFWATWCPPCIEELPSVELLHRQFETVGSPHPTLVTISVDEKSEDVTKFLKTLGSETKFTILFDPEAETARALGTTRFPESYWIRADGSVRHKWVGPQNWNSREVLSLLLPQPK